LFRNRSKPKKSTIIARPEIEGVPEPEYLCDGCLQDYKQRNDVELEGPFDQFADTCDACGECLLGCNFPLYFVTIDFSDYYR